MKSIGENLKYYRKKANLTQLELAELLGDKTRQTICMIEQNIIKGSVGTLERIAKILGVKVADLIDTNSVEIPENSVYEFIPYLMKADEGTLTAIRKLLDMPAEEKRESKSLADI